MRQSYKNYSAHIQDTGLNVELALKFAEYFGRVTYSSPWRSGFPSSMQTEIGEGISQIERVSGIAEVRHDSDLFVFPDIYYGPDQLDLQDAGKRVWGSRNADELERFRIDAKNHFKKLGIPQGPWRSVKGISKLRAFLIDNPGKKYWIKIEETRGDTETFPAEGYNLIENKLDELKFRLGPKAEITDFVIEDNLKDTLDLAIDTHTVDGMYPSVAVLGTEEKGECYVGIVKPWEKMPQELVDIYNKLSPTLKEYQCRNMLSLESRKGESEIFLGDPCVRAGSPPFELQLEWITNLPDIMWYGAEGEMVDPEYDGKVGVQLNIHSDWADKNPLMVEFPAKYRKNIKFRYMSEFDGNVWILPQGAGPRIAAVVSHGDDIDFCMEECREISGQLKGIMVESFTRSFPIIKEKIKKLKEWGCW